MGNVVDEHSGMVGDAGWSTADVLRQDRFARDTFRLRFRYPELARKIRPGQFFMVRPVGGTDPLLGRPFALYDTIDGTDGEPEAIDFVYHVIGKMTGLMSGWTGGEQIEVWGPLGNGFPKPRWKHLLYVGGGIGYTPVLAAAREAVGNRTYGNPSRIVAEPAERVTLLYGVRSAAHRADLSDLECLDDRLDVRITTDDGSEGHHGLVTDLLPELLESGSRPEVVYCCGPVPMMHAVARVCESAGIEAWLSLESPMACGFGACFSCVTRIKTGSVEGWDYRRTCVEGPVFRACDLLIDP